MSQSPESAPIIICMPDKPGVLKVSGATREPCHECGIMVWVAPTSIPLLDQGARLMCLGCAKRHFDAMRARGETPPKAQAVPGAWAEAAAWLSRN